MGDKHKNDGAKLAEISKDLEPFVPEWSNLLNFLASMYSNRRNTFKNQIVAVVHALWKVDEEFRKVLSTTSKENLPWAAKETDVAREVLRAEQEANEKVDLDLAHEISAKEQEEVRHE